MFFLLLYVAVSTDVLLYGEREREREKWNCFLFICRLLMIQLFPALFISTCIVTSEHRPDNIETPPFVYVMHVLAYVCVYVCASVCESHLSIYL